MVSSKHSSIFGADLSGQPPTTLRATARRDHHTAGARETLWGMALTLIAFKVITSALVVWYFPSWTAVALVVGLSALWILPLLYIVPRHLQGRYRLWQVRIRRRRLLEAEWRTD